MPESKRSVFQPILPAKPGQSVYWGQLRGDADLVAIDAAVRQHTGLVLIITPDPASAFRLETGLSYLAEDAGYPVLHFADWETLPYDVYSPHPDITSQRLTTLHRLPNTQRGVLICPAASLMQRLPPQSYLDATVFMLKVGEQLNLDATRLRLESAGYRCVSQVIEHGEFAVRGSLFDLFPMGSNLPFRIDLFDDEVESIRQFDPDTQISSDKVENIQLLPGREFPMDEAGIQRFRQQYRKQFDGKTERSLIYRDISEQITPGGIEYYLPLFFEDTQTLFDYLPADSLVVTLAGLSAAVEEFTGQVQVRYEQRKDDLERPLLPPEQLFLTTDQFHQRIKPLPRIRLQGFEFDSESVHASKGEYNFDSWMPASLRFNARADEPAANLKALLSKHQGRVLFTAESAGRREVLQGTLKDQGIATHTVDNWQSFIEGGRGTNQSTDISTGITVAPFELGMALPDLLVIAETQLVGERVRQTRRQRGKARRDPDAMVRDLTELQPGSPVVHEDHGVGRYLGLQHLDMNGITTEFVTLEYAKGDKLYVPVASLHLISRYSGRDADHAPLHRLGGDQWERVKRKAREKIRDVAAELLDLYARRAARPGHAVKLDEMEYASFADSFAFEETVDQETTIHQVLADLKSEQPMDRVVCGDVGFGKTEVAMRAAFVVAQEGQQVAILAPTTLLVQQHAKNFADRFADWPFKIESLSRFRSKKQTDEVLKRLSDGTVDIVIGTHKLLQKDICFKRLGLVIVDEEQRFGVRQKEQLKALRSEVDLLTLTATPIPRTLNMSMAGIRDLSIIATPPAQRVAIKTFVNEWNDALIQEAIQRELSRGGQVYFLHNEVDNIEHIADKIQALVKEARVEVGHGQMRERKLEQVMLDFYHRRFNVLVSTTIIESGIDIPNANTIIINRADKLGLAQLHQIRGRVGRSHHRAYAYLIIPSNKLISDSAQKRLAAIESMEDLGAGFALATHDLEIRGAGELLGDDQSGQIHEIGFSMYMDLLDRTVQAMKAGIQPELDQPLPHGAEVDLHIAALLPDDYIPDVHTRLILYKRIASAKDKAALRDLQIELIDRFSLLPEAAQNLFAVTEIKLKANAMGISKLDAAAYGGRIHFAPNATINTDELLKLVQFRGDEFKLDGPQKLRFYQELDEPDERLLAVNEILTMLTP